MICLMCALEQGKEPNQRAPLRNGKCPYCNRNMILVAEGELVVCERKTHKDWMRPNSTNSAGTSARSARRGV